MGNSFTLTAEADSPSTPGSKCVLSDELPLSFEDMIDGIMELLQEVPLKVRQAVKAKELVQKSEKEYTVKIILDGQKLDQVGFGDGKGTDRVFVWMKVVNNPEDTIRTDSYLNGQTGEWITDASDAVVYQSSVSKILKDPVRIEYYWEDSKKERIANQGIADLLKVYLTAVLELKREPKIKCTPDLDSLKDAGKKSVISAPIDDFLTYDKLFDAWTQFSKEFPDAQITQTSEKEVHVTGPGGVEPPTGSLDVFYDKETGELVRTHSKAGVVQFKSCSILHKEPLQVETWVENADGTRTADKLVAKALESTLEKTLEALSSWW